MKTCEALKPLRLSLPALLAALWMTVAAAAPEAALVALYPAKSIDSVPRAGRALEEVKPVREQIERLYAEDQAECYERFLVASCLVEVRGKRRKSMQAVRRIEVEAMAFLRKDKADERDRAVAARQARAESKAIPISGTARDGIDGVDGGGAVEVIEGPQPGRAPAAR